MLKNVPTAINRASRLVTLRHPNAMDCTVWRKKMLRNDEQTDLGGIPTLGGVGVLDTEDEANYDYDELAEAKIVFAGQFQGDGANWNDVDSGLIVSQQPLEALIEFTDPELDDYVRKPDRIAVSPGGGIVLIFEVLGESGSVNIPPYTRRYIIAPRSDDDAGTG